MVVTSFGDGSSCAGAGCWPAAVGEENMLFRNTAGIEGVRMRPVEGGSDACAFGGGV